MTIKKIGSILLSVLLLLSFNVYAESTALSAAEIISPADGARVAPDFSEIVFSAPEGAFAAVFLDGDEICNIVSQGENTVEIGKALLPGNHTLLVKALQEGVVLSDTVQFTAEKTSAATLEVQGNPHQESYEAGVNADGNKVYAVAGKYEGKDGEAEGSVGFKIENLDGRTITKPQIAYNFTLSDYKADMVDLVKLSFDLKVTNAFKFAFEMKNGDGGWIQPGGSAFFLNNYTISATGASYPNDEWMEMELVFDVPMQTIAVWINGEKAISEYKAENHLRGLQFLRFLLEPRPGVAEQGYYIDNFKLITEKRYNGFGETSYKSGEVFVGAADDKITESFKEIKFKTDMVFDAFSSDFTAKCFADGSPVKILQITEEAVQNEETLLTENYLALTLENELIGESELEFIFENTTSDGEKLTFSKKVFLSCGTSGIDSIEYFVNEKPCFSEGQLKAGDTLKAKFNLKNYSGENPVCVVGVYCGEKLVALTTKTAESSALEVSVLLPSSGSEFSVESFVMDSFLARKALSTNKGIN